MFTILSRLQPILFKTYIVLSVIFALIGVVFIMIGPKEIAYISFLGLAWSLFGMIINSGYFIESG